MEVIMKFTELTKSQQNEVFTKIVKWVMKENGETFKDAIKSTKVYIADKDDFEFVDYSPDEDGTDIRVEW